MNVAAIPPIMDVLRKLRRLNVVMTISFGINKPTNFLIIKEESGCRY
jgi:hypothetical protein